MSAHFTLENLAATPTLFYFGKAIGYLHFILLMLGMLLCTL